MAKGTIMSNIKLGAEVYTWFMKESGKAHANKLDHMIRISAQAGFTGIEPIFTWMGDLLDKHKLKDCLDENDMEFAALVLCLDWNHSTETDEERKTADRAIKLLQSFPETMLCTVQMPTSRDNIIERRLNLANNVNTLSKRAQEAGINCTFHPNSPGVSTNRTEEDYAVILNALDSNVTGWTPDVGHIKNGGMDPLTKMKEFSSLINMVHYKDWDGKPEWALMGEGEIDFKGITQWLVDQDFEGWIICEDEADQALEDADAVTLHDGEYCKRELKSILEQ